MENQVCIRNETRASDLYDRDWYNFFFTTMQIIPGLPSGRSRCAARRWGPTLSPLETEIIGQSLISKSIRQCWPSWPRICTLHYDSKI